VWRGLHACAHLWPTYAIIGRVRPAPPPAVLIEPVRRSVTVEAGELGPTWVPVLRLWP